MSMDRKMASLRSVSFFLLFLAGPALAFKYHHEIHVPTPGLVRCRIPWESMERAGSKEEFRLFSPEGEPVPYIFQGMELGGGLPRYDTPCQGVRHQILDRQTIVTFKLPDGVFNGFSYFGGQSSLEGPPKYVNIEMSPDGAAWRQVLDGIPITWDLRASFPPSRGEHFRLTIDDSTTPPHPQAIVNLSRDEGGDPFELMPMAFQTSIDPKRGLRLVLQPPMRHIMMEGMELVTPDLRRVNLSATKQGLRTISTGKEWLPPDHQGSIALIHLPGFGKTPFLLAGWGGYVRDDTEILGFIKSVDKGPVRVREVRARVRPYHIVFRAERSGAYAFRFGIDGPGTDPVLIFRDRIVQLRETSRVGPYVTATAGPIQVHPTVAETRTDPAWEPLGRKIARAAYRGSLRVSVKSPGLQRWKVPPEVYAASHPDGRDWRLSVNGRETPFLVRRDMGETYIEHSFKPLEAPSGRSKWLVEAPMSGLENILLRADTEGAFPSRRVRLLARSKDGSSNALAEDSWRSEDERLAELEEYGVTRETLPSICRIAVRAPVEADELVLEVEDGANAPLKITKTELSFLGASLVFKAGPEDVVELLFGNPEASDPSYPVRSDPKTAMVKGDHDAFKAGVSEVKALPPGETRIPVNPPPPSPTKPVPGWAWFIGGVLCTLGAFLLASLLGRANEARRPLK